MSRGTNITALALASTIFLCTQVMIINYIRRRKKEKKKGSGKPAAEGEQHEDAEICLGSGKDDIYIYINSFFLTL
jgi:hypothetical protein